MRGAAELVEHFADRVDAEWLAALNAQKAELAALPSARERLKLAIQLRLRLLGTLRCLGVFVCCVEMWCFVSVALCRWELRCLIIIDRPTHTTSHHSPAALAVAAGAGPGAASPKPGGDRQAGGAAGG